MSDDGSSRPRRSSFAGQTFADLFGSNRSSMPRNPSIDTNSNSPPTQHGPITQAAAQARRLSLTTLGLSGSSDQQSRMSQYRQRNSLDSNSAIDESAVEDEPASSEPASTPFARRMSFGARALMDVRGSGGGGTGNTGQNGTRSPPVASQNRARAASRTISDVKSRGEGFNWSENLRTRAERTSIAGASGPPPLANTHARAKSVAAMEPPVREMPSQPQRPDHFQERILKGDFYMD